MSVFSLIIMFVTLFILSGHICFNWFKRCCQVPYTVSNSASSSLSQARPVIWSRQYDCLFFVHDALFLLFVVLSFFSPTFVISLLQASFHVTFGHPLIFFPWYARHSSHYVLLFHPHHVAVQIVLFFYNLPWVTHRWSPVKH